MKAEMTAGDWVVQRGSYLAVTTASAKAAPTVCSRADKKAACWVVALVGNWAARLAVKWVG